MQNREGKLQDRRCREGKKNPEYMLKGVEGEALMEQRLTQLYHQITVSQDQCHLLYFNKSAKHSDFFQVVSMPNTGLELKTLRVACSND